MSDSATQGVSYCERCGKQLDENDMQAEQCQRCGRRLPDNQIAPVAAEQAEQADRIQHTPPTTPDETGKPTEIHHASAPPTSRARQPHKSAIIETYTDEVGAFFLALDRRRYEFRRGAGCTRNDITATMVRLVVDYMDAHNNTVAMTTFFAMLGSALEPEHR